MKRDFFGTIARASVAFPESCILTCNGRFELECSFRVRHIGLDRLRYVPVLYNLVVCAKAEEMYLP